MGGAFDDALLQFRVQTANLLFRVFALRDVANIALDHVAVAGLIHVADKLHGDVAAIPRFQRQVFIADIPFLLQSLQHDLVRLDVLERTQFADGFADHFVAGKAQQLEKEGIHIIDAAGRNIQDQDAILRRFKQPAITQFRGAERLLRRRLVINLVLV